MTQENTSNQELWLLGVNPDDNRHQIVQSYLEYGGYHCILGNLDTPNPTRPLGIVLDISPHSDDGWGKLLRIKSNPIMRTIPVLPVYLSGAGKVGGVFPVAGFFTLPIDGQHLLDRLAVYGLTEEAETWDLQTLVISRNGEEALSRITESIGFDVVKGYTGKEALALTTIKPKYMAFCSLMLSDMSAFELLEKFRLYPYSRNMPFFVLLKEEMKEGEKTAISREVAHLVSKKQLVRDEFLSYLKRRD